MEGVADTAPDAGRRPRQAEHVGGAIRPRVPHPLEVDLSVPAPQQGSDCRQLLACFGEHSAVMRARGRQVELPVDRVAGQLGAPGKHMDDADERLVDGGQADGAERRAGERVQQPVLG